MPEDYFKADEFPIGAVTEFSAWVTYPRPVMQLSAFNFVQEHETLCLTLSKLHPLKWMGLTWERCWIVSWGLSCGPNERKMCFTHFLKPPIVYCKLLIKLELDRCFCRADKPFGTPKPQEMTPKHSETKKSLRFSVCTFAKKTPVTYANLSPL